MKKALTRAGDRHARLPDLQTPLGLERRMREERGDAGLEIGDGAGREGARDQAEQWFSALMVLVPITLRHASLDQRTYGHPRPEQHSPSQRATHAQSLGNSKVPGCSKYPHSYDNTGA